MDQIYHEVNGHRELKDELLSLYFRELFLLIKRRVIEQSRKQELISASPILSKAIDFLAKNYNNAISVEELASEVAYLSGYSSPQYFSTVFLNKTGMTPLGYVKEMFQKRKRLE